MNAEKAVRMRQQAALLEVLEQAEGPLIAAEVAARAGVPASGVGQRLSGLCNRGYAYVAERQWRHRSHTGRNNGTVEVALYAIHPQAPGTAAEMRAWTGGDGDALPASSGARVKQRPCMSCGREFLSEGPHNRRCDECKRREDGCAAQMEAA